MCLFKTKGLCDAYHRYQRANTENAVGCLWLGRYGGNDCRTCFNTSIDNAKHIYFIEPEGISYIVSYIPSKYTEIRVQRMFIMLLWEKFVF